MTSEEGVSREMVIKEMKGEGAEFYPVQSFNNNEGSGRPPKVGENNSSALCLDPQKLRLRTQKGIY